VLGGKPASANAVSLTPKSAGLQGSRAHAPDELIQFAAAIVVKVRLNASLTRCIALVRSVYSKGHTSNQITVLSAPALFSSYNWHAR
jgi:hypothetical protein